MAGWSQGMPRVTLCCKLLKEQVMRERWSWKGGWWGSLALGSCWESQIWTCGSWGPSCQSWCWYRQGCSDQGPSWVGNVENRLYFCSSFIRSSQYFFSLAASIDLMPFRGHGFLCYGKFLTFIWKYRTCEVVFICRYFLAASPHRHTHTHTNWFLAHRSAKSWPSPRPPINTSRISAPVRPSNWPIIDTSGNFRAGMSAN